METGFSKCHQNDLVTAAPIEALQVYQLTSLKPTSIYDTTVSHQYTYF